jgi:hypothetical protein
MKLASYSFPKPNKDVTRKENYRSIPLMNMMQNSQQNTGKENSTTH